MDPISSTIEMAKETPAEVTITPEEKEKFFKCVLADIPYTETIELFDGQMLVEFKSMTVQENNDVVAQIVKDRENGIVEENDAYFITVATYRLSQSLVAIDGAPAKLPTKESFNTEIGSKDTYVGFRAKAFKKWSTFKLSAFLDAFRAFEIKMVKLTGEVQTKNFWKASA